MVCTYNYPQNHQVCNMTGAIGGAGTASFPEHLNQPRGFSEVGVAQSFVF
jgi:hypothetical protein